MKPGFDRLVLRSGLLYRVVRFISRQKSEGTLESIQHLRIDPKPRGVNRCSLQCVEDGQLGKPRPSCWSVDSVLPSIHERTWIWVCTGVSVEPLF